MSCVVGISIRKGKSLFSKDPQNVLPLEDCIDSCVVREEIRLWVFKAARAFLTFILQCREVLAEVEWLFSLEAATVHVTALQYGTPMGNTLTGISRQGP